MKVLESNAVKGFISMANDGWLQGWHERNGGNLSYRLTAAEAAEMADDFDKGGEWNAVGASVPQLANETFLVTGSGKFFRNVQSDPEASLCILRLDDKGESYKILWGLKNGGRPTSELPAHLMNHEAKLIAAGGKHRVIYHAHPANIIALTFLLPLEDRVFTRELWEMATECPVVFPDGIGVVPWMVPGGREIAVATSRLMRKYDAAVWAHHGLFCSGESFDLTFGLMHTIEKAAEILIKVMSVTGGAKRQTIQPENFRALAKEFNVTLSEDFLYDKQV
ncbi:MAG: rhamnulose-1-phosphate aldolase [Lachnospiraceae bacterium]|nr:rhamnulose-1-phosphate aldolase [Lachnospiraceae bacterium]